MPSTVWQHDFRWLCFLLWCRKLLTNWYVNKLYAMSIPHLTSPSEYCSDNRCYLSSWRHFCYGRDQSDSNRSVQSVGLENRNPYLALRYCSEKLHPSCCCESIEFRYWPPNSLLLYQHGGDLLRHSHPVSKGNEKVR